MKNLIVASFASVAVLTGSAAAADMSLKAPPAPVIFSWTGWYAGLNAGGMWSSSSDTLQPTGCFITAALCGGPLSNNPLRTDTGNIRNPAGITGGGQLGYNWQSGPAVFGIETDLNFSSLTARDAVNRPLLAPLVGNIAHTVNEQPDWFGTLRGRLGFTPAPMWLIYATGGLAYGQIGSTSSVAFQNPPGFNNDTYIGALSTTRVGWTVGGGGEWAFGSNWSVKFEYLYVDLGNLSYTNACATPTICVAGLPTPASYQTSLTARENIARFGINYHFK
jgi:outer membrane immunogenic protein